MKVRFGKGESKYGPGVEVILTGEEVAIAISSYLVAHKIYVTGPQTITINNELCEKGRVYVDPIGSVIAKGKRWNGRGEKED